MAAGVGFSVVRGGSSVEFCYFIECLAGRRGKTHFAAPLLLFEMKMSNKV